jgi:hypothetical protein
MPLDQQLPQPGPTQALLASPRRDFPLSDEVVFMKSSSGGSAILGALQGRIEGASPSTPLQLTVRAEMVTPENEVAAYTERKAVVTPAADGSFVVAYGLPSWPGAFTLRAGVLETGGSRGAAVSHATDVPDYGVEGLSHSTLMFLDRVETASQPADEDPLAPFVIGPYRLVPRPGRVFSQSETMGVFCHYYGGQVDAATGKASVIGRLGVFRNKQPQFKRAEQTLDVADGALGYGPIPIRAFSPGVYQAELTITDQLSKQEVVVRGDFEVRP